MNTKLTYLLSTLLLVTTLTVSCNKEDKEPPVKNTITGDGVEKEMKMARYNIYNAIQVGAFRFSSASSRQEFDPAKDFELYLELGEQWMSTHGTDATKAKKVEIKIKDKYYSTDRGATTHGGSIRILLGSNDTAEIKIKVGLKYYDESLHKYVSAQIECYFKGKLDYAPVFGGM